VEFLAKEWLLENPVSSAWVQALVLDGRGELRLGDRSGSAAIVAPITEFGAALSRVHSFVSGLRAALGHVEHDVSVCYAVAATALGLLGKQTQPWSKLGGPTRAAYSQLYGDLGYMTDTEVLWYREQVRPDEALTAFIGAYYHLCHHEDRRAANHADDR
jgi:hypothetical protein